MKRTARLRMTSFSTESTAQAGPVRTLAAGSLITVPAPHPNTSNLPRPTNPAAQARGQTLIKAEQVTAPSSRSRSKQPKTPETR